MIVYFVPNFRIAEVDGLTPLTGRTYPAGKTGSWVPRYRVFREVRMAQELCSRFLPHRFERSLCQASGIRNVADF